MSTTVQAITKIMDTNKASIVELLERRDSISDDEFSGKFSELQADGIWSALLELAARVDHAPKDAADKISHDLRIALAG
ncbi:hypothetical protein E3T46_17615 [Cryobacterium sp. Hh11]|uniref:hypothetical protein n=1 Tax=Cryobacterium sp. Hh11 TaxID=2555868 RepID=UPI00106AB2A5|nr:hypothetical protein [Cryobacterium sp. Hh11]TFD47609.1 hypothetical protein E3T46_17615 [Cryobacterium sp. Hh11]